MSFTESEIAQLRKIVRGAATEIRYKDGTTVKLDLVEARRQLAEAEAESDSTQRSHIGFAGFSRD